MAYQGAGGNREARDPARGYPPRPVTKYPETGWLVPGQDEDVLTDGRSQPATGGRRGGGRAGGRRRGVVLAVLGLLVVAGGGAAGYKFLHKNSATNPATSGALRLPTSNPTAQSTFYSDKLGKWQHIGSRKQDPAPLTVAELYPPAFGLAGKQYLRAATSADQNCGQAVYGTDLQTEFQSGTCSQVVRATYVSGDQKIMGTIGVVNLSSVYWSQQAARQTSTAGEFVAPLAASRGISKNILNGTGLTFAEVKGHYLILMYVEFTSLKAPSGGAQAKQLTDFSQGMLDGSANIALSTRLISGKP
ncbi:MAG TPA: hypothetical protein VKU39_09935 [Streptosporangiaceae bacterium]|nr:hypothetical protein [Streptosporangiaceae bacterium]